MKTNLLIISTILLLQINFLFAQCISIELSVTYDKEYNALYKKSKVKIPKLNITYRNDSSTNYYFLKVCDNSDNLPYFMCSLLIGNSCGKPDYKRLMNYSTKSYSKQNFDVRITNWHSYGGYWDVERDTVDVTKEYLPDLINCRLNGLIDYIRANNNPDYYKIISKMVFEPIDVLPENILGSVKEQFVFLKPGETYTDTYNLVAFQIIEGCYTFYIAQENIASYVETTHYDSEVKKLINQEIELPAVVGEYQLFSGAFKTNKLTVCFGEK